MPFPPTPSITPSNTPTSSVTPSNTPTNTPSGTQCPGLSPTPTNTLTPTITPSSTNLPTIYLSMCLPPTIPADGIVYNCFIARSSADCSGSTVSVPEYVQFFGDIYIFLDGEWVVFGDGYGYINSGQTCNCDGYNDFGLDLTGLSLSATTTLLTPSASTLANYVVTGPCFEPECSTCITPTPTPTMTPTPTITPSLTPTLTPTTTPSPTPICCYQYEITNYYTTSQTVFFTNCDGTPGSVSAAGNGLQTIVNCAIQDSLSTSANICDGGNVDCVTWVQADTPCGGCV